MIAEASRTAEAGQGAVLHGMRDATLLRDETLADLFRASADREGDRVLYRSGDRRVTWAEAEALTNRAARRLAALGAGPGTVIGLWMPRGIDLLLCQVAIAKSGAAFLPFDADAPVDRIATCLTDASAIGLLTDEPGLTKAREITQSLIAAEALLAAGDTAEADVTPAQPDDPAYLIYTSGSTGTPKGIVITQRNICHFLRSANAVYGIHRDDVVFQSASVAFDLSMEEIWVPYLAGATLVVATPETMADLEKLPSLLEQEGVTVIDTVPTLLSVIRRIFRASASSCWVARHCRRLLSSAGLVPGVASEHLWPHGSHRCRHGGRGSAGPTGDDREADPELFLLCGR